jgi:hypothetical protein
MQQQMSLVTLGVRDLVRSRAFYVDGFGWTPGFEMPHIVFFQMNGFVLGLWGRDDLASDIGRPTSGTGAFALAHNVATREDVQPAIDRLIARGATLLRAPDEPPHGGYRGYIADPDGHAWEIAWNASWPISPEGYVSLGA